MYDAIVIGAGPAGISASLYIKRAGLSPLVLYNDKSEVEKAHKIDNYYGFPEGIEGPELFQRGIDQARNLGIDVKQEETVDIKYEDNFKVTTVKDTYEAKSVLIATGNTRKKVNIENFEKFDGKGISYCAICDGFFYRNKKVAVLGSGDYALSEASDLENLASELTILTNGEELKSETKYTVNNKKIKSIDGDEKIKSITFEDGSKLDIDGLFIALGVAGGLDFAKKLGILTENNNILVNENMETNIKGVYAAGNITGGLLQVSKAVSDGAKAGISIINYIKQGKEK